MTQYRNIKPRTTNGFTYSLTEVAGFDPNIFIDYNGKYYKRQNYNVYYKQELYKDEGNYTKKREGNIDEIVKLFFLATLITLRL